MLGWEVRKKSVDEHQQSRFQHHALSLIRLICPSWNKEREGVVDTGYNIDISSAYILFYSTEVEYSEVPYPIGCR